MTALLKSFTANRAVRVAELRAACSRERAGVTASFTGQGVRHLVDHYDEYLAELARVDAFYGDLIRPLLPPAPEYAPTSDPVFQGGNASLRYFGRV